MTSTSEERREVAERLRGLDVAITSHDTLEQAVDKLMKAVCGDIPFSPIRYSVRNLCGLGCVLADLIDPTTCQMVECIIDHGSRSWGMRCTACGEEFEHMKPSFGWSFCPNCGARVVGDDE